MNKKILTILALLFLSIWLTSCENNSDSIENNNSINQEMSWKRWYIWFVSTSCPHCQAEVPNLDKFYRQYKDQVNMILYVQDKKKFDWDYIIPQEISKVFSYTDVTWEECNYIPSYAIFDENNEIIAKKCWWALSEDELKNLLLNNNDNMTNNIQTKWLENWDKVAVMKTTNGTIKIKLFQDLVPMTVNNFIGLAEKWYYNWIIFHRVIKDFMIQWWDPTGTWMWWESIYGEKFDDEFDENLSNIRGSISMANAWANTNGSQFFINQKDNTYLDNRHSVFGQVVEGLENVDKIAKVKVGQNDKPEKEVKIISLEIKEYNNWQLKDYSFDTESYLEELNAEESTKQEANKDRVVKDGDSVAVHYSLSLEDGTKIDSSYDRWQAFDFTVWWGQTIKWFDKWVTGMKIWEKKTITLEPSEAYWEYDENNKQVIPKEQLQSFTDAWFKLEEWEILQTIYGNFKIIDSDETNITIDANHELAWKTLIFDIEMVEFKD